jgi:dienelactone hydrolase
MKLRPEIIRKLSIVTVLFLLGAVLIWYSGIATTQSSNVLIRNQGVKLDGTLAMPRWASDPVPAVVVVHRHGRVRRDGLREFVRELVPQGYAVLIYDKRGVGKSTGVFTKVTVENSEIRFRELASDVSAAVTFLAEQEGVDPERIGLIGSEQAGWIMPIAANDNPGVSHFVSLSGATVSMGQTGFFAELMTGAKSQSEIESEFAAFAGPHGFDPLANLMNLEVPSLWLLGERDEKIPVASSEQVLNSLPTPGLFDVRIIPNLDHDLRDVDTGSSYEYWPTVLEWLSRH